MATVYRVEVQTPGDLSYTMQDASSYYQDKGSNLARAARDRAAEATAIFWFDVGAVGTPDIREGMEVWAGWWNTATSEYLTSPPPFGGFIMVSEGRTEGARHIITCTCSSYSILLGRATVIGWPTGEDATGIPTEGVAAGYSVTDWLTSNAGLNSGYSGVVRTYLPNIDYSGVAAAFASLIFTADKRPGNPDPDYPIIGCWSFVALDDILQDIAGTVRDAFPAVEPVYWLEAVANGAMVQPKFRWIDGKDTTGTLKATFSTSPTTGQFRIE